ncbi:CBS domain-containing protein [Roseovarius sp. Pro17]|uniref:CBS domain-containing protein n=1 Tax=Roseovarius sp. Pro17 TaxID=3108175 RepID=UPI002D7965CD|nr:CBS domain-containing protein [Roseovarius sp. Pro17]
MRTRVTTIGPNTSVRAAAALMGDRDIGMLPVCLRGKPIGIVTDRDLVIRLLSNLGPVSDVPVRKIMTRPVMVCRADCDIVQAARLMGEWQIRRLMVCDEGGRLVGVISLGDIARDASEELAGQALGETVECR